MFKNLLGGSPFDPVAYPNYLAFAASARAKNFAGPLLQQFTLADAHSAVEMDQLLKDAGVPTELNFYPSEAHALAIIVPTAAGSASAENTDLLMAARSRETDSSSP
jgi:hypothetical protein